MLPQTLVNMEMVVKFFAAASYGTTFQMKLKAKPPSALVRNVKKVGVERTATMKSANSEVPITSCNLRSLSLSLSLSLTLYKYIYIHK